MMGEKHVWIGSPKIARALLEQRAAIYSSRPPVPAVPGSDSLPHYLPLMATGQAFNRHKHFYRGLVGGIRWGSSTIHLSIATIHLSITYSTH